MFAERRQKIRDAMGEGALAIFLGGYAVVMVVFWLLPDRREAPAPSH